MKNSGAAMPSEVRQDRRPVEPGIALRGREHAQRNGDQQTDQSGARGQRQGDRQAVEDQFGHRPAAGERGAEIAAAATLTSQVQNCTRKG